MMLTRILAGALVSTTLATGALLMVASGAHAQPATVAVPTSTPPLRVSGDDSPALEAGIAYWNRLAGHTVLSHVGEFDGGVADARTVTESVGTVPAGLVGLTQGNVGSTPLKVTIDPSAVGSWVVWAHELGHTLGLGHHDETGYRGVMRSVPQGYKVHAQDDKRLISGH